MLNATESAGDTGHSEAAEPRGGAAATYLKITAAGVPGQLTLFLRRRSAEYALFTNYTRTAYVWPNMALITDSGDPNDREAPRIAYGRLWPRDGPHGRFLSGYTTALIDTGRRFGRKRIAVLELDTPLDEDESGVKNGRPVVANIYGPEADVILSCMRPHHRRQPGPV